jgi:hypothetical protein
MPTVPKNRSTLSTPVIGRSELRRDRLNGDSKRHSPLQNIISEISENLKVTTKEKKLAGEMFCLLSQI